VPALGFEQAGQIWYRANTTYLTPSSNFAELRTSLRQAAIDLYGQQAAIATELSMAAVGVGGAPGAWWQFDLSVMTGAPATSGKPRGYAFGAENRQHVVYRSTDGHVHELGASLGGIWGHFDLTAMTGAPAAAGDPAGYVFDAENRQHVVYRGADGHVLELAASL
jgi:catechol 2,3-dioxygenase-like lactoylglutathione lyase family enzyme